MRSSHIIEARPKLGFWILRRACDGAFVAAIWVSFEGTWYSQHAGFDPVMLGSRIDADIMYRDFIRLAK